VLGLGLGVEGGVGCHGYETPGYEKIRVWNVWKPYEHTDVCCACRRNHTNVRCVPSRFRLPETSRATCTCTADRGRISARCAVVDSANRPTSKTTCCSTPVRNCIHISLILLFCRLPIIMLENVAQKSLSVKCTNVVVNLISLAPLQTFHQHFVSSRFPFRQCFVKVVL